MRLLLLELRQKPGKIIGGNAHCLRLPGISGDEVRVVLDLVDPGRLVELTEIKERDQLLSLIVAADPQDPVVPGLDDPGIRCIFKDRMKRPERLEHPQAREQFALAGRAVFAQLRRLPVEIAPVNIPAVVPFEGILVIPVVIQLSDLVAAVYDGKARLGEQEGMKHPVQADTFTFSGFCSYSAASIPQREAVVPQSLASPRRGSSL